MKALWRLHRLTENPDSAAAILTGRTVSALPTLFFSENIGSETDLINYILSGNSTATGGYYYHGTTKEKLGRMNQLLVFSFWFYNKGSGLLRSHKRSAALREDDENTLQLYEESRNGIQI